MAAQWTGDDVWPQDFELPRIGADVRFWYQSDLEEALAVLVCLRPRVGIGVVAARAVACEQLLTLCRFLAVDFPEYFFRPFRRCQMVSGRPLSSRD